ncbi:MAG: AAA family ATPase [Atopobiaceae bacterium]|nr:AAA family ATPase [Atopobiaceae bacterium]
MSTIVDKTIAHDLANLLRARFAYIYITTWEEERAIAAIRHIAQTRELIRTERKVYQWSQVTGFVGPDRKTIGTTKKPLDAIKYIRNCQEDALFVLKDFHVYFGADRRPVDYEVVRALRDALPDIKYGNSMKNVIMISPRSIIPEDMQKEISLFDFPLPNEQEMTETLERMLEANAGLRDELDHDGHANLARAALGLTLQEAENSFARAIVSRGCLDADSMRIILEEKRQVIKKTGILEFVSSDLSADDIGGLENLKAWLSKRNGAWSKEASRYHVPAPKGVLITGVPGCGKSLTAKAMSAMWNLPLLKLDMGRIFSGLIGSSEENMRRALDTAEAIAPSILWVDEIEKGLGGVGAASNDSGTSQRVFGTFLTWMQEKKAPVFVIATANNIAGLPPELLRKGRFDEVFFVDLPTEKERREIFRVHLSRLANSNGAGRSAGPSDALLAHLAEKSEGFVGAEIEQVVITGLYEAYFARRALTVADLDYAIENTVPLSVTQAEQIMNLRRWANVRAVAATTHENLSAYDPSDSEIPDNQPEPDVRKSRGGRSLDF